MTGRMCFTVVCSFSLQEVVSVCSTEVWGIAEQV